MIVSKSRSRCWYTNEMLKRVENVNLYYIGSDIKLEYSDGVWDEAEKVIKGLEVAFKPKIRVQGFRRRPLGIKNISASFTLIFAVQDEATIVNDKRLSEVIFPFEDMADTLGEQIESKADELLKKQIIEESKKKPICFTLSLFASDNDNKYWLYDGRFYLDKENLDSDEVKALLITRNRMRKARINRAKTIASTPSLPVSEARRGFIPEDTRLLVWERDGGKCTKCGSRNELQFDHIIPFSLGGSSTADNLQILCGPCNRAKGNSIV